MAITRRTVVSSFIFKWEGATPLVALFRRSSKVRTYQHRLAPISGSVDKDDASPAAAAWREIREETKLTPASLVLERQGKSYVFTDPSIDREWTIFPFLFRLKTADEGGQGEQAIELDWEHEGWRWYDPFQVDDSEGFGGVPRLAQSLGRVFYERDLGDSPARVLSAGLQALRTDHQSGARQLAGVALRVLRDVAQEMEPREDSPSWDWWANLRHVAWHLWKNGRESMGAAIMAVLLAALEHVDRHKGLLPPAGSVDAAEWKKAVLRDLDELIARRGAEAAQRISGVFAEYLRGAFASKLASHEPLAVLTLSESSTIALGLRHLVLNTGFSLDLRVLESRPLFEGASLAGRLVRDLQAAGALDKATVTLYADAAAGLAAEGADLVLLGADRVAQSGAVSNKTGSLPAVLCARHAAAARGAPVRVIVLTESEKVAPPGDAAQHVVEENDPEQLVRSWRVPSNSARVRDAAEIIAAGPGGGAVSARNVFFEWCPGDLIDVYVTEMGPWSADEVRLHSERLGAQQESLFGDL